MPSPQNSQSLSTVTTPTHTVADTAQKPAPLPITPACKVKTHKTITEGRITSANPQVVIRLMIDEKPLPEQTYQLTYVLKGLDGTGSVVRQINSGAAQGGYLVRYSNDKTLQSEIIPANELQLGENTITYKLPPGASFNYEVSQVKLQPIKMPMSDAKKRKIEVTCPPGCYYGDKAYIRGVVRGRDALKATLAIGDQTVPIINGLFEAVINKPISIIGDWQLTVKALYPDGELMELPFLLRPETPADFEYAFEAAQNAVHHLFTPNTTDSLTVDGASITVLAQSVKQPVNVSLAKLRPIDLPPIPSELVNVTRNGGGFRFLPHGQQFTKPAHLTIGFDSTLIPQGYGPSDVFTFYFDEASRTWQALEKSDTNLALQQTHSVTTHFTDMINGVIKVPESPQTAGYTPTQLQGMKAADPSAGIAPIDPPQANNNGSASLSFPIKLPAGRMGMQPSLGIGYNSGGGAGWLGLGWDLSMPAVTIDTKLGVPRYMADKESETYTISGMELTPKANKEGFDNRTAEKRFYPRTEGSFSKIIRHGTSPSTYWWEVTDKSGGHTYYGGTPETGLNPDFVMTDAKGNIGYWALAMQVDVHGNNIKYSYAKQTESAQQLTPTRIAYTGFGNTEGAYSVNFECAAEKRTDASTDCRLGFVRTNDKLLTKITVAYGTQTIRTYNLTYKQGAFYKTLLDKITELDAAGNELYSNGFGYYDDVRQSDVYQPWGSTYTLDTHDEYLSAGLIASATLFSDRFTSISGSKSAGGGGGGYIGVGLGANITSKGSTVGGNFGYSYGENKDVLKLMDVDADGLPDKLFSQNGNLYYRHNQGFTTNNANLFGDKIKTLGAPEYISTGKSNTYSRGLEAHPIVSLGYTRSTTTSKTPIYPSDFNSDGIIDFAKNGRVLFGYLNNGILTYSPNSGFTPVPIKGVSVIDDALIPDPSIELDELTGQFPLHDVVRVWQAPYNGTITIVAPVSLIAPSSTAPDDGRDGVKVSIQQKGNIIWPQTIDANDFAIKTPTVGNRTVNKGDRIYFRVQSIFNGLADQVNWNPTITYIVKNGISPSDTLSDANGLSIKQFNAEKDFVDASSQYMTVPIDGTIELNGQITKPLTSDTVKVQLIQTDTLGVKTIIYTRTLLPNAIINNSPLLTNFSVKAQSQLSLLFSANTNINWADLKWKGTLKYTSAGTFNPADIAAIPMSASYGMFPVIINEAPVKVIDSTFVYKLVPFIKTTGNQKGYISYSVKNSHQLIAQKTLQINADTLVRRDTLIFKALKGEKLYFEYHIADLKIGQSIALRADSLILGKTKSQVQSSVYTTLDENGKTFGNLWRGWGQFVYNGNRERANKSMNEDDLKINIDQSTYENNPVEDISNNEDLQNTDYHDGVDDIFVIMGYYPQYGGFMGQDTLTLVKPSTMQSSRRGLKDIRVESVTASGEGLPAMTKVTKTKSDNYSASFYVGGGYSKSAVEMDLDMMDMNGDRYPDVINNSSIQYTLPAGTLNETISQSQGVHTSGSEGASFSIGGEATSAVVNLIKTGSLKKADDAKETANKTISFNGSFKIPEKVESSWIDINGDGLPDLLESDKDGELTVKLSTINRTNLLKTVTRPMGATFELGYGQTTNSYNDPQSRRVLTSVKLFDGLKGDGADTTLNTFTYSDPYYDRAEREFFGFAKVETHQHDTQNGNAVYRTVAQTYNNRNYHTRQAAIEQTMTDGNGKTQTKAVTTYQLRDALTGTVLDAATANTYANPVFVAMTQQQNLIYQGYDTPQITTSQSFGYDLLGNVTDFTDYADGRETDRMQVKVTYHDLDSKYIKALPKSMEVTTVDSTVRKRDTEVDANGNITQINQYNTDGSAIAYNMAYDPYGNLTRLTRPKNHKGERMFYDYIYDGVLHMLVTDVTDAYGYTSSSAYDYATQAITQTTDLNNQPIRYTYDGAGRLSTVTGPLEIAAGKPYTLAFDYAPLATVPYARTRHYDLQTGGDMETYTFMDGLMRPVQVKKTALVFDGKDKTDAAGFTVSGKQQFDAFGRTLQAWQNTFEKAGTPTTYNTDYHPITPTATAYDVNDRPLQTTLPDGAKTTMAYNFAEVDGGNMAVTTLTDALNRVAVTYTDAKGRQRSTTQKTDAADITTTFAYNPLGELLQVTNPLGQKTISVYDMLGRRTSVKQPDNGLTSFTYDAAGNLIEKVTANIRKNIPNGGAIKYTYDFERVTQIDYPKNTQNKVQYSYGLPGEGNGRAGRLTLVQDGSGGQEFFYSPLGQVSKTIRTLMVGNADIRTYIAESTYDTWNRVTSMVYPDGETVTYAYDAAGNLQTVNGQKDGRDYVYVNRIGYDTDNRQVYMQYGNGTETTWSYEKVRKRLDGLTVTSADSLLMDNSYTYDAVDNILGIVNKAPLPVSGLGCNGAHSYVYDQLNRLVSASGSYTGTNNNTASYTLAMAYDAIGNIQRKNQQHTLNGSQPQGTSQNLVYAYNNGVNPNAPSQVGNKTYTYDANGNPTQWEDSDGNYRQMLWDEENRLTLINDNGMVSNYTYDHAGERAIKSYGGTQGVYINGAPAGSVDHSQNSYTIYVSPYLVVNKERFTKHIYAGTTRICSKIGNGGFNNQYRPGVFGITAGSINYMARAYQIAQSKTAYYKQLGIPPGPPTLKGVYAEPETTGNALPASNNTNNVVPAGWPRYPKFAEPGGPPGPPIQWGDSITNATVEAGFGYIGTGAVEELDRFFYHPDHIGSSSIITNAQGIVTECMAYMPFGEILASQKNTNYAVPYLFTSKELDSETGLYYFGARYYDPNEGRWWGVDLLAEKHNCFSSYNYCFNNPVRLIDPNGMSVSDPPKETKIGNFFRKNMPGLIASPLGGITDAFTGIGKYIGGLYNHDKTQRKQGGRDALGGILSVFGLKEIIMDKDKTQSPTSTSNLPNSINNVMREMQKRAWNDVDHPERNGMHAWHAGTNAALTNKLGPLGGIFAWLVGVFHETPFDRASFRAEQNAQGTVNHFYDSVTDLIANTVGMVIGLILPEKLTKTVSLKIGNQIPGPGDPDPHGTGGGGYTGNPTDAWWQWPGSQ